MIHFSGRESIDPIASWPEAVMIATSGYVHLFKHDTETQVGRLWKVCCVQQATILQLFWVAY